MLYPLMFPNIFSLIRYVRDRTTKALTHYIAPFYYYHNQPDRHQFALFYFILPAISLFHYSRRKVHHSVTKAYTGGAHPTQSLQTSQGTDLMHGLAPLYNYQRVCDPQGKVTR